MASPLNWVTPPTFSASRLLSATALNKIQQDLAVLFGVNFTPPMAFSGTVYQTGGTTPDTAQEFWRGYIEHQFDTLTLRMATRAKSNPGDPPNNNTASAWLAIAPANASTNTSVIATASSNDADNWAYAASTIDLSSLGLIAGSAYILSACVRRTEPEIDAGQVRARMDYLFESAGSTGWTTPPTIASPNVGAASDLNIWRDDLNWLKNRIALDNHGFGFFEAQTGDTQPTTKTLWNGYIKHTGNVLNFRWGQRIVEGGNQLGSSECWLTYNGSTAACTTCNLSNKFKYTTGSLSLSGKGLVAGNFYEVTFQAKNPTSYGGQVEARLEHVFEIDIISPSNWSAPKSFAQGASPDTGSLQTISDNLTSLHDERRDVVWPTRASGGLLGVAVDPTNNRFGGITIIHRAPWLHYLGEGQISYGQNSVTFSDPDDDNPQTTWGRLDLDTLAWLPRGAAYLVSGENLLTARESFSSD